MKFSKSLLTIVLVAMSTFVTAQEYPVQVTVVTTPPYYNFLSYYGDQNNHLTVITTLTDFNSAPVNVRLRLTVEGPGYTLQTRQDVPVGNVYTLSPGFPVFIQGSDLLPLLQPQSLVTVSGNPDFNNLPEGFTTVCAQFVEEGAQGTIVSNKICSPFFLQLMQPSQPQLPMCNSVVDTSSLFQTFQWSPPQNYVPSIGADLNYTFSLYEWIDTTNFNIFQTGQGLVYSATTQVPIVQVSSFDVTWQTGRKYVWRVQAELSSNSQPVQMITQQGLSQPCSFYFGKPASLAESLAGGLTINLTAEALATRKGRATWTVTDDSPGEGLSAYSSYIVQYRRKPVDGEVYNFPWNVDTVPTLQLPIYQLEPERTYQVRVAGIAGDYVSEPTEIVEFTTPPARDYACGESDLPYFPPTFQPLEQARMSDIVQIGQFPMMLTYVQPLGPPGRFSGRGLIEHDFIGGAKVKVKFDNLLIDADYNVREGVANAMTDGVDAWLNDHYLEMAGVDTTLNEVIESGGFLNDTTVFVVVGGDSLFFTFNGDMPIVIHGAGNVEYQFWPNGTMVVTNYGILPSSDQLDATRDLYVRFESTPDQQYGFDAKEHDQFSMNYEAVVCQGDFIYFVANKSKALTGTETVKAVIHATVPNFSASGLEFRIAGTSALVPFSQVNDSTFLLTLPARSTHYSVYAIYADFKLGKLNVKCYPPKTKKVTVVPLVAMGNISEPQLEAQLNNIFRSAGMSIDVTLKPQFNTAAYTSSTTFSTPNTAVMTKYTEQMRELRDLYLADNELEAENYLLFIIPGFQDPSVDGYMVRGKGVGFIAHSSQATASHFARTIAHELGHGIGGLEHVWENSTQQGTTDNLLDYSSGTKLIKDQWEALRSPGAIISLLDPSEAFMSASVNSSFTGDSAAIAQSQSGISSIYKYEVPEDAIFRTKNGFYVTFPDAARSSFTHFSLKDGLLKGLWNGNEYYYLVTTKYTFETVMNSENEQDTIAWEHPMVAFACYDCEHPTTLTHLENGDSLTTFKFIEQDIQLTSDQFVDCEQVGIFVTGIASGTLSYQAAACQESQTECETEYHINIEPTDQATVLDKLNEIIWSANAAVGYNAIRTIGDDQLLTQNERAVIGEKIKTLHTYRANTVVAYVFMESEGNSIYTGQDLKTIAQNAVNSASQAHPGKTIALFLMNYGKIEQQGLLQISNKSCMNLTFATNQANFLAPGFMPNDLSTANDLYSSMLLFFTKMRKPYYKFNIYEKYDGSLVHHLIQKTSEPEDDIYGLPFVHGAQHLISKYRGDYEEYQTALQEVLDEYEPELEDGELSVEDLEEWQYVQDLYMPLLATWKLEDIADPAYWYEGNVPFDNIRESKLNRAVALAEFEKVVEGGPQEFFTDLAILQYGTVGAYNIQNYYEFNVMDRVVDPIVYGALDVLGCIPVIDFFADGAGALYATARGDGQQAVIYTAALATPFVGAAVYHTGQRIVNYYAKETAQGAFQIQAKLLEENLQGWVKISDDIPVENTNVTSKVTELNSPANLSAFDDETVEVLVKLKKVWNSETFYGNADEFAKTYDKLNQVNSTIREEVYNLYKQKNWEGLETYVNQQQLNGGWPPGNGGYNTKIVQLKAGQKYDRYQESFFGYLPNGQPDLRGGFTAPMNGSVPYSYEARALRVAESENALYYEIEVLEDLEFTGETADVIPWFGQVGNGKQTKFNIPNAPNGYPKTWNQLVDEGKIRITIKQSPNGQYNNLINTVLE